jgi:lysine-specific demethylase 3
MTSLFSTSWMCRLCGREACAECFAQVKELTVDRPGANQAEIAEIQAKREKHAHSNPFFLSCTRRNEHQAKDFSPMSRFCKKELSAAIEEMEKLLNDDENQKERDAAAASKVLPPATVHPSLPMSRDTSNKTDVARSTRQLIAALDPYNAIRDKLPPRNFDQPYVPSQCLVSDRATDLPARPILRVSDSVLTPEIFPSIWALGLPLVVTDVLSKFKIKWTPEYFMEKYGSQSCLIIECQTEVNKRVTVGEFFSWFGKYEGRENCWKLKVIFFSSAFVTNDG